MAKGVKNQPQPLRQATQQSIDAYNERMISKQASSALLYLLFYSILMFTLPFGAYFGTQYLLVLHSDFSQFAITSISVCASVAAIYVIIGLYACHAYHEKDFVCNNGNQSEFERNEGVIKSDIKKSAQKKLK